MEGTSPRRALQELLRRGTKDMRGADKLAAEANRRRRELLQRNNLDGTLQEIKKLLDEARAGRAQGTGPRTRRRRPVRRTAAGALPPSPAKAVQELSEYDWRSPEAAAEVRADQGPARPGDARPAVRRHEAGAGERHRRGPSARQRHAGRPQRTAGQARRADEDSPARFRKTSWTSTASSSRRTRRTSTSCWTRWPSVPPPRSGSATACREDQRAELDALAQQAFGSPSLMNALNRLDAHLQAARPGEDWTGSQRFRGDDPLGMGEGAQALADIGELEQLAEQLSQSYAGRHDGRRRPRHAGPPARRRGRRRRPHAGRAREAR